MVTPFQVIIAQFLKYNKKMKFKKSKTGLFACRKLNSEFIKMGLQIEEVNLLKREAEFSSVVWNTEKNSSTRARSNHISAMMLRTQYYAVLKMSVDDVYNGYSKWFYSVRIIKGRLRW